MKKQLLITLLAATLSLSACFSEKNPLSEIDPKVLAQVVIDKKISINKCAKIWSNPDASDTSLENDCANAAFNIAVLFKDKGYGEINSNQVKLPEIWMEYQNLGGVPLYDPDAARESMNFLKPRN